MSEDVRVVIKGNRGNPPALTQIWPVPVVFQLDKLSMQEAVGIDKNDPHFLYNGYSTQVPVSNPQLLQQNDELIDQLVNESVTGLPRRYRIINDPEFFGDGHVEIQCRKYRGGN